MCLANTSLGCFFCRVLNIKSCLLPNDNTIKLPRLFSFFIKALIFKCLTSRYRFPNYLCRIQLKPLQKKIILFFSWCRKNIQNFVHNLEFNFISSVELFLYFWIVARVCFSLNCRSACWHCPLLWVWTGLISNKLSCSEFTSVSASL